MDTSKISAQITCPICISPIKECCVTKCGHAFCKSCLEEALHFNPRCPYCNTSMLVTEFYRFYQYDSLVSLLIQSQNTVDLPTSPNLDQKVEKEEPKNTKQMISIKTIINDKTRGEHSETVNTPCDLNSLIKDDVLDNSTISLALSSTTFPFILTQPTTPLSITISSQIKEKKLCIRYRFVKGMVETFYICHTCNVKFICSSCAETCHVGHDIALHLKIPCSNAVCYCQRSKVKCQLTLDTK
ncbi:hypothetical protein EIN_430470 [Entamoeba invadens IP1]|uniref:RING-type domain-containing protein n=1 Tax=Entamoeba invadens IP1 TaxID=370355 RepID=A0A0A1UF56_ENTIV|nr:hypothetical protein EIN_430470 [Entamoeba invadens IP1]ELP95241.1 hypothetical protein EIN_430470 [Entamoeba invadens IP1]|eukprot:XP_004262012.1 hypothetical protein EIN_430470 [Entamoeba invadens IP1]